MNDALTQVTQEAVQLRAELARLRQTLPEMLVYMRDEQVGGMGIWDWDAMNEVIRRVEQALAPTTSSAHKPKSTPVDPFWERLELAFLSSAADDALRCSKAEVARLQEALKGIDAAHKRKGHHGLCSHMRAGIADCDCGWALAYKALASTTPSAPVAAKEKP